MILAFITSRKPDDLLETDVVLDPGWSGYSATGLRVPAALRLHRLMTVATSVILRELGILPRVAQDEVDRKLLKLFGLENLLDPDFATERPDENGEETPP